MTGLLLPCCSIFFSGLLISIFFSKKRINLLENKIFSYMIIFIFFDSILATLLQVFTFDGFTNLELFLIEYVNKIDFVLLIAYTACLLFYTLVITYKEKYNNNFMKKVLPFIVVYLISIILIMFLDINIISNNNNFSVDGAAVSLAYITCGFNIVLSIIIAFANYQSRDKRYKPIYSIVFIALFLLFIFKLDPYLIVISITLTFVNYIMYNSIENPDLKLIEELEKSKDKAEKYSNDKAIFLFNMSQQIRGPLNNIETLSEQIIEESDKKVIKEKINNIRLSSQKLQYIVNDSLDISTLEAKNLNIVESKYNLRNIINEVSLRVKEQIDIEKINFNLVVSEDLPLKLYGDSIKIKQILNTLLFNAVKYTERGFIELNISSIIKRDVCRLIIKVEDSGCGMKTEKINKLFEKHDKEECSTDKSTLTLDTLKKLINLIGGTIIVQSEVKKGTEFTVTLDQKIVEEKDDNISKSISEYKSTKQKKLKVLVVDDEEETINATLKMFDNDVDAVVAKGGQAALEKLRNNEKFDIIFLDETLNKLNASTTFRRMNQIVGFDTPVIIMTELVDKRAVIKFNAEGYSDILLKPIKLKDLDKIISKYIKK